MPVDNKAECVKADGFSHVLCAAWHIGDNSVPHDVEEVRPCSHQCRAAEFEALHWRLLLIGADLYFYHCLTVMPLSRGKSIHTRVQQSTEFGFMDKVDFRGEVL